MIENEQKDAGFSQFLKKQLTKFQVQHVIRSGSKSRTGLEARAAGQSPQAEGLERLQGKFPNRSSFRQSIKLY